ncbi:MAG: hypothetical protein E7042_03265 [Lentisphaerae bacterium]|nr:hypothetical protein [Lentisphaerota bacterium]
MPDEPEHRDGNRQQESNPIFCFCKKYQQKEKSSAGKFIFRQRIFLFAGITLDSWKKGKKKWSE